MKHSIAFTCIFSCTFLIDAEGVIGSQSGDIDSPGVSGKKPNYIIILADDLGFGDVGFNGSTQIKTPNMDHLAKIGVMFTQGYVSSAVCAPSRAGLMTGINQVKFGFDNNLGGHEHYQPGFDPEYMGLPVSVKTIAERLNPLGYVSGLIGKWHLGYEPHHHPLNRGFDEFWGYQGGGHDYFRSEPDGEGYLSPIESNYKTPQPITYLTDDKGDECVGFIHRHKDQPFFLFASFNAPHTPMQATKEDLELYKHIEDTRRRTYAAMVHRLDVNIGRILSALKENGLCEKTLIVFLSDNGGPVTSNASINAPYNGQKGTLLEGGIHVPFVMSWPGTLPAGLTYSNPVSSLDITPTFLDLAGGEIEGDDIFCGVNLIPFILGTNPEPPHEELKWRFTISAAIRDGDWKLIRLPDRLPMLFHLGVDPSEQNNVALENIEKTKVLLQRLGEWDVSLPHPLFLEGARWKRVSLDRYDEVYQLQQPNDIAH